MKPFIPGDPVEHADSGEHGYVFLINPHAKQIVIRWDDRALRAVRIGKLIRLKRLDKAKS